MKKGQQEVYPLKMNAKEIFALFNSVAFPEIEFIDSRNVILFEVDSLRAMLQIEKALLKSVVEYNPKWKSDKLVSNKRKPLFLKASLLSNPSGIDMWQFHIYQEHAKGIIIETNISLNSYVAVGAELSIILSMLTERYYREIFIHRVERKFIEIEQKYALLELGDLHIYLDRVNLTSIEKKQIIYTKDFYLRIYDEYVEYIDDGNTYNDVISSNEYAKIILDLCEQCLEKFSSNIEISLDVIIEYPA
jgi:hypothetical protein